MRKFSQFLVILFLVFSVSATAFSDDSKIDLYGVKLVDSSYDGGSYNLYAMLNQYLGLEGSEAYSSSLTLFNERGIDPTTQWTTSGSSLLKAFHMSELWHQLNVLTPEGQVICNLYDAGDRYEDGQVYDLPDDVHLDFQMLPFLPNAEDNTYYNYLWAWYSDPSKNNEADPMYNGHQLRPGDDEIHMLAFDITDLYNAKKGTEFTSVYMFGWEDWSIDSADFDYNDMVVIMTNLTPESSTTPEPATMLIFLAGGGLVSARYLRRRKNH
jgi:hypothetical protein